MVNLEEAQQSIVQLLRAMPDDYALDSARFHLNRALSEVQHVSKKRTKRQQNAKLAETIRHRSEAHTTSQWKIDPATNQISHPLTVEQGRNVLKAIEGMIESEEQKMKNRQQQREQAQQQQKIRLNTHTSQSGNQILTD